MRSEITWRADEHGMLLGAPMHDGSLVKFVMTKESLEFGIRAVSGEFVTVELTGLGRFTVRELWSYPIVSEFWVHKVGSVPESWSVPTVHGMSFFQRRMTIRRSPRRSARRPK